MAMTMRTMPSASPITVDLGLYYVPLYAATRPVFTPYRLGGIELWHVKTLSGASVKKAQYRPYTQLIEATSCVETSEATPCPISPLKCVNSY